MSISSSFTNFFRSSISMASISDCSCILVSSCVVSSSASSVSDLEAGGSEWACRVLDGSGEAFRDGFSAMTAAVSGGISEGVRMALWLYVGGVGAEVEVEGHWSFRLRHDSLFGWVACSCIHPFWASSPAPVVQRSFAFAFAFC